MNRLNLTLPIIHIKMYEIYSKFKFQFIVIMSIIYIDNIMNHR